MTASELSYEDKFKENLNLFFRMPIFSVMFGHLLLSLALVDVGVSAVQAEEVEDGAIDDDFDEDFGHYEERKFSLIIKV